MTILATLQTAFDRGQALKIISGLTNFDAESVARTVKAADRQLGQTGEKPHGSAGVRVGG